MSKPWDQYMRPFRVVGDVFFVGTISASSHLIDTGDGLILLDSGYPQTLYLMMDSIRETGFSPYDIKYIIHSHGHYDHIGGTRALVELTGAKTFIGRGDEDYVNGRLDLTYARELGFSYEEAFTADEILEDGAVIHLGNIEIACKSTPGHTPGTLSFFFDVKEDGGRYRVGTHGGVGTNTMEKQFIEKYGLSFQCRNDFRTGLSLMRHERVDVFIGNHQDQCDTLSKCKRMGVGKPNPFIEPDAWLRFLDSCENRLNAMLNEENLDENMLNSETGN